ncbi:MAG: hypothetical protein CVU39_18845 [Chloroflexi bacterium HGW-Chloroflexi-10]|nr:MAG: hypothetical protein CVU39_18845 [Chloroflexi bacterium HGW-Chloroflexi-10]
MAVKSLARQVWQKSAAHWLGRVRWFALVVSLVLLFVLAYTLSESRWVRTPPPLFAFALFGAFSGWLLGFTRWSIGWCALYNFFMAFAVGVQYVGKILPQESAIAFEAWLETTNWQIFLFIERANGWLQSVRLGEIIHDEGCWSLLLIVLVWIASAWLALGLKKRKNAWLAVFPLVSIVAFILQSDRQEGTLLVVTLFFSIALITWQYYSRQEKDWQQRQLDFPDQLWMDWGAVVTVISIVVLFFAGLAPTVTTPDGWREIREWVDEITNPPQPSDNGGSPMSGVYSPGTAEDDQALPLLQPPDVSRVGSPLPVMEGTVMWVRVGDSTPRPWRIALYSTYTGSGWLEAALEPQSIQPLDGEPPPGRKALLQRFTLSGAGGGRLFAAADPVQSLSDDVLIVPLAGDNSHVVLGDLQQYELVSWVPNVASETLRAATGEIPQEIQEAYLQLPDTLPERVRSLAHRLVSDEPSYYERVLRVQKYVRESVPYDLQTPAPSEGQDVVDYFLYEATSGFCTYYASAMAVLLRIEGIPARLATGYAPGTFFFEQANFQVSGDSAHAWVEVYFPGLGWIPFEPTPSQEAPFYAQMDPAEMEAAPRILTPKQAARRLAWLRTLIGGASVLAAALIGWLVWRIARNRSMEKKLALHPAALAYRHLRFRLTNAGISAPPSETPREFFEQTAALLADHPQMETALQVSTELYERAVYSADPPERNEVDTLRLSIRQAARDGFALRWRYLWQNFMARIRSRKE